MRGSPLKAVVLVFLRSSLKFSYWERRVFLNVIARNAIVIEDRTYSSFIEIEV